MAYKYKTNVGRAKKHSKESSSGMTPEVCVKRMYGKQCRFCEKVAQLYEQDTKESKNLAGKCRARSTFYMNILDMEDKKAGIQVYGCGVENWRTFVDFMPDGNNDEDGIDFTDPESCTPILLTKKGSGLNTSYSIRLANKQVTIGNTTLSKMNKLHEILELLDAGEVTLWKPAERKNKILILPPWGKEADGDFYKEISYHWNTSLLSVTEEEEEDDDEFESEEDQSSTGDDVPLFEDDKEEDDEGDEDKVGIDSMDTEDLIEFAEDNDLPLKRKDKKLSEKKLRTVIKILFSEKMENEDDVPF